MNFREAFSMVFAVASGRKLEDGQSDNVEQVTWAHAITGIALLVVVQAALVIWSSYDLGPAVMRDLAIVAMVALAVPFIIFAGVAAATGRQGRLPGSFLYLGVIFAAIQLVSAAVSFFGVSSSGFLIGIVGAVTYMGAKSLLRLGWAAALGIGVLVVVAFVASGLLLTILPSGQLFR